MNQAVTPPRIVALTPNPALDITISIDELLADSTIRIDLSKKRFGGKGINVASVAASQGYPAVACGPAAEADRPSEDSPFVHGFTDTPARLRHTYAIYEAKTNNTTIINERGETHPPEVFETLKQDLRETLAMSQPTVVTVSGSLPVGTPEDFLTEIIAIAHDANCKVIADTSGAYLLQACKAGADIVKPNIDEAREATGIQEGVSAAEKLLEIGAGTVVLSAGKDGLTWVDNTQRVNAKLPKFLEGNPTGAGDALVAALACSLVDELETEQTLKRAVAWSAAAVLEPEAGAIHPTWPQLETEVQVTALP